MNTVRLRSRALRMSINRRTPPPVMRAPRSGAKRGGGAWGGAALRSPPTATDALLGGQTRRARLVELDDAGGAGHVLAGEEHLAPGRAVHAELHARPGLEPRRRRHRGHLDAQAPVRL